MSTNAELQNQVLDGIRQSQTAVVDAVRTLTEQSARFTPELPETPAPLADLPSPGELIAGSFDFAEKLLASQRAFAEELVAAATPDRAEA